MPFDSKKYWVWKEELRSSKRVLDCWSQVTSRFREAIRGVSVVESGERLRVRFPNAEEAFAGTPRKKVLWVVARMEL